MPVRCYDSLKDIIMYVAHVNKKYIQISPYQTCWSSSSPTCYLHLNGSSSLQRHNHMQPLLQHVGDAPP
jgi:hypothetical protein